MPRKAEFIFPSKRCEWPILSSLTIHEAFFEVPITKMPAEEVCQFGTARIRGVPDNIESE